MHQSPDEYEKTDLVGKGSFGFVYKAIHRPTRQVVAVKILSLEVAEQELVDVQQEIALLSQLKAAEGVNVTKYYGAFMKGPQLWIIMDYCSGGSVRTLMKPGRIQEKYLNIIVRETVSALAFIHKIGVIHRDVKAANILVGNDGRVQLCDFGVSALVKNPQTKRSTFVGTPWWMAPEVILENQTYDYKADIWSLGITILEIANGHPPYHDQEPMRALLMIPRQPPSRLEGGDWSQALRDFVSYCLCELATDRMSAEELSRQKLLKSTSRTPVGILRDLVLRLEQWQRAGNVRNSLIGGPSGLDTLLNGGGVHDDEITWDFEENQGASTPTFSKTHASQSSLSSFLSLDSNETVKAAPPAPPKGLPLQTGSSHPLLQLFATNDNPIGGLSSQTPMALQPAFQPTPPPPQPSSSYRPAAPSQRSPANTRPASPEPLMTIELPSFDDLNGDIIAPSGSSPAPLTQIDIPSLEEDFVTMRKASTPLSQAQVVPSVPSAPLLMPNATERPDKYSGNRGLRAGPSAHAASKSADIPSSTPFGQGPQSPAKKPPPQTPESVGRGAAETTTVSAPSSPRTRSKFSHAMPASSITNSIAINGSSALGRKPHHLPSLSAPQVSFREGGPTEAVPPVPSLAELSKNKSAESTPLGKPRLPIADQEKRPSIPTLVTSGLPANSGAQTGTPRATGFRRADLQLKLPANPIHGIEVSGPASVFPHSPGGRFLSPFANSNSAFGSQTPTPTAATHAQSFHFPAGGAQYQQQLLQQQHTQAAQHLAVQTDPWGMPLNVMLNPSVMFPSATNEDVANELERMLGLLNSTLNVFEAGLKQTQNIMKGGPGPVASPPPPSLVPPVSLNKQLRKPRLRRDDSKQSDTEGFVSESN